MGWAGQAVRDEEGNRFVVGEECPCCTEEPKGRITCTEGGGFSSYMKVRCTKCGKSATGYDALDMMF